MNQSRDAPPMDRLVSTGALAADLGVSPSWVRALTESGVLSASRTPGGHRRYPLNSSREAFARYRAEADTRFERTYPREGLEEHVVWQDMLTTLDLERDSAALTILRYSVTEMVNNAIDHSGGSSVVVTATTSRGRIDVTVRDDGVGAFEHLARGLGLSVVHEAVAELSKGRRTTAPERHSGEGIFFTSKALDIFSLEANGIGWTTDNIRGDMAMGSSNVTVGTSVRLSLERLTTRRLVDVFRAFTDDDDFIRTNPVVLLFNYGVDFVSRSEAKRLLAGLDPFKEITVDFTGVVSVGQAFVDEVFRVWPSEHPGTSIEPVGMNPEVAFMVRRGLGRR